MQTAPSAIEALSAPRSALFGGADGHLGSVFTPAADGTVMVRLRFEDSSYCRSSVVQPPRHADDHRVCQRSTPSGSPTARFFDLGTTVYMRVMIGKYRAHEHRE